MFSIIEYLYKYYFDSQLRQKVTYEVGAVVDYENPRVVGRNRRPAHSFLRSFQSPEDCLKYWSDANRTDKDLKNVLYLTGEAGKPSEEHSWSFLLVGNPKLSPKNWELPTGGDTGIWNSIALPGNVTWCTRIRALFLPNPQIG